jgi:hypothetical protein
MMSVQIARAANQPADFKKYHVNPDYVEAWEDGMRTNAADRSFEWWYLDASMNDGSSVVLTYMTKDAMNFGTKLTPWVSFEWTDKAGQTTSWRVDVSPEEFSASKEHCDVKIGKNTLSGDLKTYTVHFEKDDVVADLTFENTRHAWRPGAGANEFGDHYFAWLPAVPAATVSATIQMNDQITNLTGKGYHDHNWGNESMLKLMHHWYWGRAAVGDYQVISTETTAEKAFGYTKLPVMMIDDHGQLISGDAANMTVEDSDTFIDEGTNKPVQKTLRYRLKNGDTEYIVTYAEKKVISGFKMIDQLTGAKKALAKLAGFDGAYLRFTGDIIVQKLINGQEVDQQVNPDGIWELMYFGKTIKE